MHFELPSRTLAEVSTEFCIRPETLDGGRKIIRIAGLEMEPRNPVLDHLFYTTDSRSNDWDSAGKGLDYCHREALVTL